MNRQRFQHLESGQGVTEYALLAVIAGIAAIGIITLLGGTNFREGIIYEGIYRPVQCAVQGISQDNCEASRFNAVRFPSVYDNSTNSRKLCNEYNDEGNNLWADSTNCGDSSGGGSDPAADMIINRMQLIRESGGGYPFNTTGTSGTEVTEGNYEIVVSRGNNVDDLGYRGPVESVRFQISPSVDKANDGTSVSNVTDDVDSNVNSLEGADSDDYTVNNYEFVELVAGTSYTITATPFSENGAGGDPGTAFQVTIDVVPSNVTPPAIQSVRFIPSISTRDTVNLDADTSGNELLEGDYTGLFQVSDSVESVTFRLNGPTSISTTTHDNAPYYLFDTTDGNTSTAGTLDVGSYTLTATPHTLDGGTGADGDEVTIGFNVLEDPAQGLLLSGFNLINADTDEVEQALVPQDAELELFSTVRYTFDIEPLDNDNDIESVSLSLSGPESRSQTENIDPYALYGDNSGNYNGEILPEGEYTLTATAYDGSDATGQAGDPFVLNFTVVEPEITSPEITAFHVRNAATGNNVTELTNGGTIDLGTTNYVWNLSATTDADPSVVDRVEFTLSGDASQTREDRTAPYIIPEDEQTGIGLGIGNYTLEATIYPTSGNGTSTTSSVNFEVINSAGSPANIQFYVREAQSGSNTTEFEVNDGDTIDLAAIDVSPWNFGATSTMDPNDVDQVVFELSGATTRDQTEGNSPYALPGDQYAVDPNLGSHTLKVTFYPENSDISPGTRTISFDIVDTTPVCPNPNVTSVSTGSCNGGNANFTVSVDCVPDNASDISATVSANSSTISGTPNINGSETDISFSASKGNGDLGMGGSTGGTEVCNGVFDPLDLQINWPDGGSTNYDLNLGSNSANER